MNNLPGSIQTGGISQPLYGPQVQRDALVSQLMGGMQSPGQLTGGAQGFAGIDPVTLKRLVDYFNKPSGVPTGGGTGSQIDPNLPGNQFSGNTIFAGPAGGGTVTY